MRHVAALVLVGAVCMTAGCAAVVVGGAATGVALAEDRRTVGTVTEDQSIELKAATRIGERYGDAHINTTSYNRMLLLTGEAPSAAARTEMERIARAVENVRGVHNELHVGPRSALSERANDAFITSKVKARFVDAQKFNALHVKVVTERSVVYLLGMVRRQEAADATEVARTTSGVQKVVRVFEYLD